MATVTIPVEGSGGNPVRVIINGVEYVVPRGAETTVSDAVAAELAKPDMALTGGSGYPEDPRILPLVTDEDAGKILQVGEDGKWAAAEAAGGDVFDMTFVADFDPENLTVTCDKTFAEYEAAHAAGNIIRAVMTGDPNGTENTPFVGDNVPLPEINYGFGESVNTPGGTFKGPSQVGDDNGTEYLWWPVITLTEDAISCEIWTYPTLDD